MFAALVLDLLGVPTEAIVEDYMLTGVGLQLVRQRLRQDPVYRAIIDGLPASRLALEAATMERFLSQLHNRLGGARKWALGVGISNQAIHRIADHLLEA